MLTFLSFGSGSCGNCYYLSNDEGAILIDAGVGIRRMKRNMKEFGLSFSSIRGIIITHDHADHIKAAGQISKEYNIPVYATELVHKGIRTNYHASKPVDADNVRLIEEGVEFGLGGFSITAFGLPHDSLENMGYCIRRSDTTFTIMTDVGMPTEAVKEYIARSNYLVLESNYDVEMLRGGKYPRILQDRIMSGTGHLSNRQAAEVLAESIHPCLKQVWLCHLSEENNHPELARKTMEMHLRSFGIIAGKDFQLEVLRRQIPTGPFRLEVLGSSNASGMLQLEEKQGSNASATLGQDVEQGSNESATFELEEQQGSNASATLRQDVEQGPTVQGTLQFED